MASIQTPSRRRFIEVGIVNGIHKPQDPNEVIPWGVGWYNRSQGGGAVKHGWWVGWLVGWWVGWLVGWLAVKHETMT